MFESQEGQKYNYIKGNLFNNLGSLSLELNELDQAYEYINQAQEIRKQDNNQQSLIASNNMLSEYYILKGKPNKRTS
ncbi:MAG: hypothetical protein KAH25_08605 [Bacteroidales bacterium]|nr:hypothetical protein [Bacteroidales bacterium]